MTMETVGIGELVLLADALAPMPRDARYSPIPEDRYHDDGSCWDRQAGAPGRCSIELDRKLPFSTEPV